MQNSTHLWDTLNMIKREKTNYRNGSTKKSLKSEFGEFEFETPRDRNGEFEPKIVPKNNRNDEKDIYNDAAGSGLRHGIAGTGCRLPASGARRGEVGKCS